MGRRSGGSRQGRPRPGVAGGRSGGGGGNRGRGRRPQGRRQQGRRPRGRPAAPPPPPQDAGAKPAPPSLSDRLAVARGLFTKKRYGEALREFDSALQAAGDGAGAAHDGAARREADRCRAEVERTRAQLEQISERIRGAGGSAPAALGQRAAACRFRLGQYGEALGTLEEAAAASGGAQGYAADMLAGDCLSAMRRNAEAEDAYLHALDDGEIPAGKCVQIAEILASKGRHAGAESAYAKAAEKGADVHRKLETCRARIGQTDFAHGGPPRNDRTRMAIATGKLMEKAMRLDKDGRYGDAVPLYIEAFRTDPRMPAGFADRMAGLAARAAAAPAPAPAPAPAEAPHSASHIPAGTALVVDSNVCIRAMIMHALGKARSKTVPRGWAELAGVASSFEKNVKSGAYVLTFKVYHETRSLLYSTRGIGDLLLDHSREIEVCRAAAGKLDKLWGARGAKMRPNAALVDEAKRAMWAGWMSADSHTKAAWRSRKEVPEKPYKGGCSGEWADASILASAIMILRGAGAPGGGGGGGGAARPGDVALLTKDSDFTMFAGGITAESGVRIVSRFE